MASIWDQARNTLKNLQVGATNVVNQVGNTFNSPITAKGIGTATPVNWKPIVQGVQDLPASTNLLFHNIPNAVNTMVMNPQYAGNLARNAPNYSQINIPGMQTVANFVANSGQTFGQGLQNMAMGVNRVQNSPGILNKTAGVFQTIGGAGQTLSPFTAWNQVPNFISSLPQSNAPFLNQTQRLSAGIVRGMAGDNTLSPNIKNKNLIDTKILGQDVKIDPFEQAGQMLGFVKNPINNEFFKLTDKILPTGNLLNKGTNIKKWIAVNGFNGSVQQLFTTMGQMPENATDAQKVAFMAQNAAMGAMMNIGGHAISDTGSKVAGKVINSKLAVNAYNELKDLTRRLNTPVTTMELDANGNRIVKPLWQYQLEQKGGGLSIKDINKMSVEDYKKNNPLAGDVAQQPLGGVNSSSNAFERTQKDMPNPISGEQPQVEQGMSTSQKITSQIDNPSDGIIPESTQDYIKRMQQQQSDARRLDKGGIIQQGKNFLSDVKRKLVDSTAPIEDILASAQKKGKFQVLPANDISNQIDRALRSRELAGQFLKDNGMIDVIRQVPDINALDQYLIAKHAPEVATVTGRNAEKDAQLVKDLAPQYEPYAQKVVQYGQKLLDYAVQSGLVSKEVADALKKKYPNYVPLNRIFNELEKSVVPEGVGGGPASLSKQTVVQKLQGSERAIQNPIESLLLKTKAAFAQGERNQAGKMLASYKDLPGFEGLIKEVPKGEKSPVNTFSYLDNGVKRTFETTPEIAKAAKFLDKRQLGFVGQLLATPVRIARVGITGINIPFITSNVAKDQVSAFINSDKSLQTSIANPAVFIKSLWTAIGHGKEYDNWIRTAGGGTSFDISRSAPEVSVSQIRAGRNLGSKALYTVTHPGQLLRTVENIVNRGEEMTRLQQFIGTRDALLKQGRTLNDANILAAKASRENTVNFARSGDWGKALNSVFMYMNAGIQGSRTLMRNLQNKPIQTSAKIGLTVFTPLAAVTAWNMSDPQRKAAYDDIRTSEKDNNLILVPPNPVKDAQGRWNVIKIPFSQEIANLTIPVRKSIEALHGADPPGFMDFAASILGTTTSLNTQSPNALIGQFVPQAVKPGLEAVLNKNLFTGNDIVPQFINGSASKDLPPELQARPNTSGTARIIGKVVNTSPLKVEQFIKSSLGGVGSQAINASDTALAAAGAIPSEQIGGQSIPAGIQQRFSQSPGGNAMDKVYSDSNQIQMVNSQAKKLFLAGRKQEALQLINDNKDLLKNSKVINEVRSQVDTYNGYKNKVNADTRLTPEQKRKVLDLIQAKLDQISNQYYSFK